MKFFLSACFLVLMFVAGCKPENEPRSSATTYSAESKPRRNEESAAERKLADYIAEERIKEIQDARLRIAEIQRRIDAANSNTEAEIRRRVGTSWASIGSPSYSSEKRAARAAALADIQKSKERDEKALADAQLHLRSLLRRDDRPEK